jgi:signal transduction histidine kinase
LGATTDDPPETRHARVGSEQPPSRARPASWSQAIPLLALLAVVQISVPLFGPLQYPSLFWVSTGLLLVLPVAFWDRYPRAIFSAALIYLASACCLNIAAHGNENAGLGVLLFLPVVGVAVAGSRRQAGMIVAAVAVGSMVVSLFDDVSNAVVVRRTVLYFGISVVISIAIITLREPLMRSRERAKLLLKDAQAMNDMARRLAELTEPSSIKRIGAELAATVGSPPGSARRRGAFLGIEEGRVTVDSQFDQLDDSESSIDVGWPSPDDPLVDRAIRSGTVVSGTIAEPFAGSESEEASASREVTYATWVPIVPDGHLEGLLGVASQRQPMPSTSVEQLISLGHFVELALSNWSAHERLEEAATREDRRRIARELHDGLAQELAFITSKTTSSSLARGNSEVVQQVADAADRALDEARRAIVALSDVPEALHVSVTQTVEDLAARHGMTARLEVSEDVALGGDVTENLLRIIREAITNAARHGHASTVAIELTQRGDVLHLQVTDDGRGFDDNQARQIGGFGLTFMEERCALMGGSLQLSSQPGTGTRVEVRLPA